MYPKPANEIEETMDFINSSIDGINQGSNLQLVVLEKKTGEFLGCSGLHKVDWAKQNIDFDYIKYPVDKRNFASRTIPEKHHGIIQKEYKHINLSGEELDIVEYWIYK